MIDFLKTKFIENKISEGKKKNVPVRLADVLYFLGQNGYPDIGYCEMRGGFIECPDHQWEPFGRRHEDEELLWNLRQDDLVLQSREVIDFLYKLSLK